MFIAHRGLVKPGVKENTIPAFLGAINTPQYAGFELDIYTSLDKEFVVHHSPLVEGEFIWQLKYSTLKKKGLSKLEDVLKLSTSKIILIEIKDFQIDIPKLTKLLNKYSHQNIYVMSFFPQVIAKFTNNKFKIGVLNYVLNSSKTYSYDFIGIIYSIASFSLINALKKLNIEVFLYGLNKKSTYIYSDVYYIVNHSDLSLLN